MMLDIRAVLALESLRLSRTLCEAGIVLGEMQRTEHGGKTSASGGRSSANARLQPYIAVKYIATMDGSRISGQGGGQEAPRRWRRGST